MKKQPLTVTIVAQDEADQIGDAIRSVSFADEIIVLDSGSTDDTVSICRSLGARVIQTDWPGYGAQKNRAMEYATHDWILSLDADEIISEELKGAIINRMPGDPPFVAYSMPRRQKYLGRWMRFSGWYPDVRVRLFRKERCRWKDTDLHERVEADGPIEKLAGDILHEPYRDLADHLRTINRYSTIFAKDARARGRKARWWDVVLRPPLFFLKRYLLSFGFMDGLHGIIVCGMGSFYVLCRWVKLMELQRGWVRGS